MRWLTAKKKLLGDSDPEDLILVLKIFKESCQHQQHVQKYNNIVDVISGKT
jgi:hypothetical protein